MATPAGYPVLFDQIVRIWIKMRLIYVGIACIVTILVTSAVDTGSARAQQAAAVGVDSVRTEPLSQTQPVIGRFVSRQSGIVAAQTAGAVTTLNVQVGDRVKRGAVIAVIDIDRLTWQKDIAQATVAEMEAQVSAAEARLDKRILEAQRLEGIRESAAFSQARYDDAIQDWIEAEASLKATRASLSRVQANLRLAEDDLRHGRVRAPYNGVITGRLTEVGSYVNVGSSIVTMINEDDLEIEADVPYNRIAGLAPGTPVSIMTADGQAHGGEVRAVGAEENAMSRTRVVRFTPTVQAAAVKPAAGESVDVLLPIGLPRDVVTVHKDAILKRQGMSLVYVIDAESTAQVRPIEVGEAVGPRFEVLDGLAPGEVVVVRGNERLRPGQAVSAGGEG